MTTKKYITILLLTAWMIFMIFMGIKWYDKFETKSAASKAGIEITWINRATIGKTNENVKWFPCEPEFKTNVPTKAETQPDAIANVNKMLEQHNKLPLGAIEPDYKMVKIFEDGHLWVVITHRGIVHPSNSIERNMIDGFTHSPDCPCLKK